jgi:colanic acid biosynthesis glycosyl transferase WcaI
VLLPNWVDCQAVTPRDGTGARATFGLPENAVIALYSGNLGHKQGLDIVAELAEAWQNRDDVHFAVFGAGPAKAQLERAAARLPNLTVGDLVPSEQLAALLSCADIHLLPQAPEAADLVLPSKLTGMLASGRPVIAAARPGTELCRMVEGAGIAVPDNTVASFDGALRELVDAPERRSELARTARARAEETFDKTAVLARLEANLYELSAGPAMNDIPRPTVARGE